MESGRGWWHGGREKVLQDKRKCDWHLLNGSVLFRQMCESLMSKEREREGGRVGQKEGGKIGKPEREREREAVRLIERDRCRGSQAAPID